MTPYATPNASNIATDSYPNAPQPAHPHLGNGIYGNALIADGAEAWYWDGSVWHHSNAHLASYPETAPVFDLALRSSIVLTNGETGSPVDTWAWTGTGWTNLNASPPGVSGLPLCGFDEATQQLIALVSGTWRYDGTNWQPAGGLDAPDTRYGTNMVYDPLTRQLLVFGGFAYNNQHGGLADTWTWNGQAWTLLHPSTAPPAGWESLAYDPDTRQLLLMDEQSPSEDEMLRSGATSLTMWNWDGTNWRQLHPGTLPPIGFRPTMGYDSANHQLLFFEGTTVSGYVRGSQTWAYSGGTWQRVG